MRKGIIVTLPDTPDYRRHAMAAGADGFISKAESTTALLPLIATLFPNQNPMSTSTAIDLRVRSMLAIHITHLADGRKRPPALPVEGAHAGRSTETRLGGALVSTFVEDRIARNELWLTVIDQRRDYLLAAKMLPHLQAAHVEMLDSWETSIKRRLASAWVLRHSELLHAAHVSTRRAILSA